MKRYRKLVAAVALAGLFVMGAGLETAAWSAAKAPTIALVNYNSVFQDSKAGQSVKAQVTKQREIYLTEIKKVQADLQKQAKELEQQQSVLAKDVFEAKVVEFRRKQREAKQTENSYRRALDQMQQQGLQEIEKHLDKILESIAKSRGIDIVMKAGTPGSVILKAREELFITKDVVTALDKELPKVDIPPAAAQ